MEEWLRIADEFSSICKMPNWIGSIDVKHCRIKSPPNAGSFYFNYKSSHSINLLGVSAANCCFTLIDMGVHCENDSDVFGNSSLEREFSSGDFIVLLIRNISGTSISIELYFVGDEAFPPKPNLRPLQGENSILQKAYSVVIFIVQGEQLNALLDFLTTNFGIFQNPVLKPMWK